MNSFRVMEYKVSYIVAAAALLLAVMVPAIVAAASVTERSIELSSSSISATNVTYKVNFTPAATAGAFVVDFCSNSPVIGETCTPPAGFTSAAAASTTPNFTDVSATTAQPAKTSQLVVTGDMTTNTPVSVELTGITNPSASGPLYARIVTYDTKLNAATYTPTDLKLGATDQGGVAMSITDTIGVSGTVLETMTFCVSGMAITENCSGEDAGVSITPPVLKLGETVGTVKALSASAVSTGSIYTQISTNASTGAIVSLKSSALGCGGLMRSGAPTACDIAPATLGGNVVAGTATFGVKTAASSDTGSLASGVLQPLGSYNNSTYFMNYVPAQTTGVTSTYGDPFLTTNSLPVNNKNMMLTFAASVSNDTPAGAYSADLSMIATGKF